MRRTQNAALVLLLALAVGCQSRYYTDESPTSVGGGDGGADDAPALPRLDAPATPAEAGGGAPDLRVDTGGGPCVRTGGPETCNGRDDDCNGAVDDVDPQMLTDVLACGSCNVVCSPRPNATARCTAGACAYECQQGAVDIDKGMANGCECLLTNEGKEVCDTRDNDCNGVVDDGFDLAKDVNNCGACNKRCIFPYAEAACASGGCVMGACLPGFFDRNRDDRDGCELACAVSNGGTEVCDGLDNDCDGQTDEGVTASIQCKGMGVCAGTRPECQGKDGWVCVYDGNFQESEDRTKGCDGKDNDCDGKIDEGFDVGRACSVGIGACAGAGLLACDPANRNQARCTAVAKTPLPEICNGTDDDCDGKVDELEMASDRTTDDRLVYLAGPNVTMFAYEASRPDATDKVVGAEIGGRGCSVPGRLPWSNVTQEEAVRACAAAGRGWRLCTRDEWFTACRGAAATVFPYGNGYAAASCNGWDYVAPAERDANAVTTVPVGSAMQCRSDLGGGLALFDMSGNLKEWVLASAPTAMPRVFELRGGAYNVASFGGAAPGLQCDAALPAPSDLEVRLPSVGFRCCLEGKLP